MREAISQREQKIEDINAQIESLKNDITHYKNEIYWARQAIESAQKCLPDRLGVSEILNSESSVKTASKIYWQGVELIAARNLAVLANPKIASKSLFETIIEETRENYAAAGYKIVPIEQQ